MDKKLWTLDLGARVSNGKSRFRVWAPKASSVSAVITGESTEIKMNPQEHGYFAALVDGLKPGSRYFYLLDGEKLRPDPVSRSQPEGVHGPSELIDPDEFTWKDQHWKGIPFERMIIYELHTGTFTAEGTFESIIPCVHYLKSELGVTAIELMPVAQFPGERNWGYDGTCLYAPQNSYGGAHGLKVLVNACHKEGLAVILDVVYNHLGPEGSYLGDYAPYYTDRYNTPWGSAINFDGPGSDEVCRFVIDNALYWVTEYHLDGLRLDAIHGIFDFSARHILRNLREAVHEQAEILGRHVAVIAESNLNDARIIDHPRRGGYGLDAQWNDDFHHCLHTILTEEQNGYYQDFGDLDQLAKALQEGFVYGGQYSSFRKKRHGNSSRDLSPAKFIVFSQNHDQIGNRKDGDRLSTLVGFDALKLAAGIVMLSPNIPLLFMGEEYGEIAPFQYFISHSDQQLIEAVREGRRKEFASFHDKGEVPDPQDEATFLRSKTNLSLKDHGSHNTLLDFYRMLIRLRKEIPSLSHLSRKGMEVKTYKKEQIVSMERRYGEDRVCCIFSFSDKTQEVNIFFVKGAWQKVLDSSSRECGCSGGSAPEFIQSSGTEISIVFEPYSLVVYRHPKRKNEVHEGKI